MVTVLDGQLPHAPLSFSFTANPSISTNSTSPPSAIKYGRTSSSTSSMLSAVNSSVSFIEPDSVARVVVVVVVVVVVHIVVRLDDVDVDALNARR